MTLPEAKAKIAEKYGKASWIEVMKDFEFGTGLSKFTTEEALMDMVAELHAASRCRFYVLALKKIEKMSVYNVNHDEILYAFQNIHDFVKETLKEKP
jgi:hypothetical protein